MVVSRSATSRLIDPAVVWSSLTSDREYTYTHVVGVGGLEWVVDLEEARGVSFTSLSGFWRQVCGLGRIEFATARQRS